MERVKIFAQSLLSRKFLLALVAGLVPFGNAMGWWELETEEVWQIIIPIMSFIGIEGVADIKGRK